MTRCVSRATVSDRSTGASPNWVLREVGHEARDGILALRREVFASEDPEKKDPAFWQWEFVENSDGPARLFVAEDQGRIVGHYGIIPQRFSFAGQHVKGSIVVDVMTHPDYRFQGMFKKIGRFSLGHVSDEIGFAIGYPIRKEVMPGHLSIGWNVRLRIPVLVRPLDWGAVATRFGLSPMGRTLRAVVARWRRISRWRWPRPSSGEQIRRIGPEDLAAVHELFESSLSSMVYRIRTEEYLRWRYFSNPAWNYDLVGLWCGDTLQAFVALRRAKLLDVDSLAVVDAACREGMTDPLVRLLLHAIDMGTSEGLAVAGAMVTTGNAVYGALRRAGFYPGPHRFSLIVYAVDSSLTSVITDVKSKWFLMWGDTDDV